VRHPLPFLLALPLVTMMAATALIQGCASREADQVIASAIRKQVAVKTGWFRKRATVDDDDIQPSVRAFYKERRYMPAWTHIGGPTADARALVKRLGDAPEHGLDPKHYDYDRLKSLMEALEPGVPATDGAQLADMASLDVELTRNFLKYATHLATGQVNPLQLPADWHVRQRKRDMVPALVEAVTRHRVGRVLDSMAPKGAQYAALKQALGEYRALAARGDSTSPGRKSSPGPDAATLARRIRLIELNMERWRWVPDSLLGDRYVMVNIPEFMLRVVERGRTALAMRVVVGKEFSKTPMFTDEITYMVLNPTWNVPASIAVDEILPEVQRDRSYLTRNNMRVFENETDRAIEIDPADVDWSDQSAEDFHYAIRQDPGPANPVGHVKFMCPNQFNVYLHDTPSDRLFAAEERDFSHGCIRLEKPVDFAVYLMKAEAWSPERVKAAFDSAHNSSIKIPEPLPVRIFYWTVFTDERGVLQFCDDVYGLDELLDRSLRSARTDIKQPVRTALLIHAPKPEPASISRLRTRSARKRAA